MKINISKEDVVWNYIGTIFSMGMGYLLLPFLLIYFDDETIGLWYIFMSLANVANLFIFGFAPSFARNVAYCWNGTDKLAKSGKYSGGDEVDNINCSLFVVLLKTCKKVYLVIALTATVFLSSIGTLYVYHIAGYMLEPIHYVSWMIFLLAIFLNLYFGYYVSLLGGIGRVADKNKAQVVASLFRIVTTAALLMFGMGFLGACIAYLIYGFVFRIISKYYFEKSTSKILEQYDKKQQVNRNDIWNCFRTIWPNTWREGLVSVSDFLCTQAGTMVGSFFLTLAQTGVYSLSVQLVVVIAKVARSFQLAYIPALQSSFIRNDKQESKEIHSMCILVYCCIFMLGILALFSIGIPLLKIIKPEMLIDESVLIGIGITQFIIVLRNCYASYLSTTNRIEYWKGFIISGCGSIVGSIVFLYFFQVGVWGIIIAALISELVYNAWYWPLKVHKELQLGFCSMLYIGYNRFMDTIH